MNTPTPATQSKRLRQWRTILSYATVFVVLFGIGYLIAIFVVFPPPAAPSDGIAVPSLKSLNPEAAAERLRPLGLVLGDSVHLPHATVAPGLIVAQDPLPGQQLRSGDTVRIGVSSGLPSAVVPDLIGLGAKRAQTLLERLGFEVAQNLETSEKPNGTVIRSTPEAGVRKVLPARVVLFVSTGVPPDSLRSDTMSVDTIPR